MHNAISATSDCKIVVVGDVMLDRYISGTASRVSPEAPVPVINMPRTEDRLGGAANVAVNVTMLGGSCDLFGLLGSDRDADLLKDKADNFGLWHFMSHDKHRPTTVKLRVVSQGQQLARVDYESPAPFVHAEEWYKVFEERLNGAKNVILSDYNKGCLSDPQRLIDICRNKGLPVIVDPKGSDFSKYLGATIITPNEKELQDVVGHYQSEDELQKKVEKLICDLNIIGVLLTRGPQGMSYFTQNNVIHFSSKAKEVLDVTGAGDTVISALATFMAKGFDLESSINLANIAAGLVVGKSGTNYVSLSEIEVASDPLILPKALNHEQLKNQIDKWKSEGEKLVFTNGCFDILHVGHVDYLMKAKKLGSKLIVALNSDASVKLLKGNERPVNTENQRATVLSALMCVDAVVIFDEETPEQFYNNFVPDILVKGGDYAIDEIIGADVTFANGGVVEVIAIEHFQSTSQIIEKLKAL